MLKYAYTSLNRKNMGNKTTNLLSPKQFGSDIADAFLRIILFIVGLYGLYFVFNRILDDRVLSYTTFLNLGLFLLATALIFLTFKLKVPGSSQPQVSQVNQQTGAIKLFLVRFGSFLSLAANLFIVIAGINFSTDSDFTPLHAFILINLPIFALLFLPLYILAGYSLPAKDKRWPRLLALYSFLAALLVSFRAFINY